MKIEYSEVKISSIPDLFQEFQGISGWIFRGHSDSDYNLTTSLERYCIFGDYKTWAGKLEKFLLSEFQARAHHYITKDLLPAHLLGWLALMQHHGCPTRMLDFTNSPYIALFFAQDTFKINSNKSMCIWAINRKHIEEKCFGELTEKSAIDCNYEKYSTDRDTIFENVIYKSGHHVLYAAEPNLYNLRLENQMGLFLLSGTLDRKISDFFVKSETKSNEARKIIISGELYNEIIKLLFDMGINNRKIYPGLDGASKDIASKLKVDLLTEIKLRHSAK